MEDAERRFKIQKLEKYNEDLSEEKKKTISTAVVMGLLALVTSMSLFVGQHYQEMELKFLNYGTATLNLINVAIHFGLLLESMKKKIILETKIDIIKDDLGISEDKEEEEEKGMSR